VYEAVYNIHTREFPAAARLLLNSIATFTCYELLSYQQFILYTVVTAVIATDRHTVAKYVLKAPEILQSIDEIPFLREFMDSLYEGRYADYFHAVAGLEPYIATDTHLSLHLSWIVREIRIVAYQQFLLSYRSVTLESMAKTFGVSIDFLDRELFRFIGSGRLTAKIDRVSGVVETVKADTKNRLYAEMIQHGDALLNRVQKLTKVFSY
jgi:26S proteasome regulatory subunit N7